MKSISRVVCVASLILTFSGGSSRASDKTAQASRLAVQAELQGLAARTQQFFRHPASKGGGGHSFETLGSITQLTSHPVTANGTYVLLTLGVTSIVLTGQGKEISEMDGNPILIGATVYGDSIVFQFYN